MKTLILTQGYLPHRVVGWQKAVSLSYTGKVEVVETYDELVRSPRIAMPMPAVVRLTRHFKARPPKVRFSRQNVLLRDDFTCQYCGAEADKAKLTFDHVIPRSQGGKTRWDNIVTACRPCNSSKGNRTPEQAGMVLKSKPQRPESLPFKLKQLKIGYDVPDPWKSWVWWS